MRRRLSAGVVAALAALLATSGTALAEPPAGTNPNVVQFDIVDCGEFTGAVTIVAPESGRGGSIVGFAGGQVGVLISLVPAADRFPHELLDCAVEVEGGAVVSFPILVPKP